MKTFEADVVVVGGGMSGCLAAVAAARAGCSTIIVEREAYLGGTATAGLMGQMVGAGMDGHMIFGGHALEFVDRLIESGHGRYNDLNLRTRSGTLTSLRYDVEPMKFMLDDFLLQSGVRILFNSIVLEAQETPDDIRLEMLGLHDRFEVRARYAIDTSGNSVVATKLGHETFATETAHKQAVSIIFRIGNVDQAKLREFDLRAIRESWFQSGDLPARFLSISPVPGTSDASVNATMLANVDHESTEDVSRAVIALRKQIHDLVAVFRERIPGLEDCQVSTTASALGVRDARRIVGRYMLTSDDVVSQRQFEDAVAPSVWPIDVHDAEGHLIWVETKGPYQVPFSCMVPQRGGRLVTAGKIICADDDAFAATRVMSTGVGVGEAAGEAAALAVRTGKMFDDLNGAEMSAIMRAKGYRL